MRLPSPRAGSPTIVTLLAGACVLFSLGASCDSGAGGAQASGKGETTSTQVEELQGVDASALTGHERERWVELVNAQLSPCGEPISVAQCVTESRACSACVPAARYLVRLVGEGFEPSEIAELYAARYDAKKKVSIPIEGAPERGAPMAPVTIVEFSDFECPYCGAAHPLLKRALEQYDGRVKLVFKHFPLSGHKHAAAAARAAAAAQLQGKFWQMADLLFEHQRELSDEKIGELAKEAGLDMAKFDADLESEAVTSRVEGDKKDGKALDVAGTPTLYVNQKPYLEPLQNLPKYLEEELGG